MKYIQRESRLVVGGLVALMLSACGQQPNVVKQIDVQTQGSGKDAAIVLSSQLDLNGFSLGSFELPIVDPRNGDIYGSVKTQALTGGLSEIDLSFAIGELLNRGGQGLESALLPNGKSIPIATGSNNVWMLNVGSKSRIYIAALEKETLVGFALVIPQFDSIVNSLPFGLNFFPVIPVRSDLDVAAGIFTGSQSGTSGVGLFADLKKGISIPVGSGSAKMAKMQIAAKPGSIGLQGQEPSDKSKRKLAKKLNQLRNDNPHLTIQ